MLEISKNQLVPGQKIEFDKNAHLTDWYGMYNLITDEELMKERKREVGCENINITKVFGTFEPGDIIEVMSKVSGTEITVKFDDGGDVKFEMCFYWSTLKKFTTLGSQVNLGSETVEYVIFHNGKKWKPKKFKDLGKIKASLMDAMGYGNKLYDLATQHFKWRCPEIADGTGSSYWVGNGSMSRKDFSNFEIFEWSNRKLGNKVDFDAVAHYDSLMDFIRVSAQFGSAVRQQYKTYKDDSDYKYILCFVHEDYRNGSNPWYEELKESPTIKHVMKEVGIKGTKKCTKSGKTAICFKNSGDMMKVAQNLEQDSYYVLDMQGRELEESSAEFIVSVNRAKMIDEILNDFA